jgi:hypothetical protein
MILRRHDDCESRAMLSRALAFVSLALAFVAACGCAPSYEDEVRDLAAADMHCDRDRITVRYVRSLPFDERGQSGDPTMPSTTFLVEARGCSTSMDYACTENDASWTTPYRCCNVTRRDCDGVAAMRGGNEKKRIAPTTLSTIHPTKCGPIE